MLQWLHYTLTERIVIPTRLTQQIYNGTVVGFDPVFGEVVVVSNRAINIGNIQFRTLKECMKTTLASFNPEYEWPTRRLEEYLSFSDVDFVSKLTGCIFRSGVKSGVFVTKTIRKRYFIDGSDALVQLYVLNKSTLPAIVCGVSENKSSGVLLPIIRLSGKTL